MKALPLLAAAALLSLSQARGAVIVSGDVAGGSAFSVEFTQSVTFTITSGSSVAGIAFDEWVTSDGHRTGTNLIPSGVAYTLNGGSVQYTSNTLLWDNQATPSGDLSANDGWVNVLGIAVNPGDTLIIQAQTINTSHSGALFNSEIAGAFSGDMYLIDVSGNALTALTPVPEPSTALLGLLAGGLLLRRRRN